MDKLKEVILKYGRWAEYSLYVERIVNYSTTDFSLAIENSKSLVEGICKQICENKNVELTGEESFNKLVKKAFDAIGFKKGEGINIIGSSLSAISHQIGNLRTAIGSTSHGKTAEELKNRNTIVNEISKDFLIETIDLVASFLIRNFENENPLPPKRELEDILQYREAEEFNEFWDDSFGEFTMGDYSYPASEILFNVDKQAYVNEYKAFIESEE